MGLIYSRQGALLIEAMIIFTVILSLVYWMQGKLLRQMDENLTQLQKLRLVYDGGGN